MTLNPEQDIIFAGFILRAPEETIKQIKHYILTETDATIVYQKKSIGYLKISPASPPLQQPEEALYSLP